MIILDTNVLSEQTRPRPSEDVMRWAMSVPSTEFYTTSISEAEMLVGLEIMPAGQRRTILAEQIQRIFGNDFASRILTFDSAAARALSLLPLRRDRKGKPLIDNDALIAAIATAHDATIATRDTGDFRHYRVRLVNPWTSR